MKARCPFFELFVNLFKHPHEYVTEGLDSSSWQFYIANDFDFLRPNLSVSLLRNVEIHVGQFDCLYVVTFYSDVISTVDL